MSSFILGSTFAGIFSSRAERSVTKFRPAIRALHRRNIFSLLLSVFLLLWTVGSEATVAESLSDPEATALAERSRAALKGTSIIRDVTLTGTGSWFGEENGPITLSAVNSGKSRVQLVLASGTRSETRDSISGIPSGKWIAQDGSSSAMALHNCLTDAAWFFPAFSSLSNGGNATMFYVGRESRNDVTVEHVKVVTRPEYWPKELSPRIERSSTTDYYLDSETLLPVAVAFVLHPDNDLNIDLPAEVEFSEYRKVSGVMIPMHIRKFLQGNLILDVNVTGVSINTGLVLPDAGPELTPVQKEL